MWRRQLRLSGLSPPPLPFLRRRFKDRLSISFSLPSFSLLFLFFFRARVYSFFLGLLSAGFFVPPIREIVSADLVTFCLAVAFNCLLVYFRSVPIFRCADLVMHNNELINSIQRALNPRDLHIKSHKLNSDNYRIRDTNRRASIHFRNRYYETPAFFLSSAPLDKKRRHSIFHKDAYRTAINHRINFSIGGPPLAIGW